MQYTSFRTQFYGTRCYCFYNKIVVLQYIIYFIAILIHETQLDIFHEDFNKDYDAVGGGEDLIPYSHWVWSFIHSLVFSLRGRVGRNQSPVM